MRNESGSRASRWRHIWVAVAVCFVAAWRSLARAQRPVSHVHTADNGRVNQRPDSAMTSRSGLGRLAQSTLRRTFLILLGALLGWWALAAGVHAAAVNHAVSASANATVISSWNTDPSDYQIVAHVLFRARSGRFVWATIWPGGPNPLTPGREVPIRYDLAHPHHAFYAGPYGDIYSPSAKLRYIAGAILVGLAGALLLISASWLTRIMRAAVADVTTPVALTSPSLQVVRTNQLLDGYSLEWRLLADQPDAAGDVRIIGKPAGGRWLVVRLADGRHVWPSSRAEPVLESAALRLPVVESGRVGAVHRLLASYTRIVDLLGALPLIIRRPPARGTDWVWRGGLRPVINALVTLHLRRRLAALGSALLRAALLSDYEPDSQYRQRLADASDECRAFAKTLPRRGLLIVLVTLATIAATVMSIVSPFLVLPHIQLSGHVISQHVLQVLVGVLILGFVPMLIFFESVRCKRALFNPAAASSNRRMAKSPTSLNTDWDVYKLERAAFAALSLPEPNEWESRQPIRWLIGALYLAAVVIPLGYAYTVPTLSVLGGSAVLFALIMAWKWQRRIHAAQATPDQPEPAEDTPPQAAGSVPRSN